MTVKFKKWPERNDYYEKLKDITSEPYAELTNKEVLQEISRLLKNNWLSHMTQILTVALKVFYFF